MADLSRKSKPSPGMQATLVTTLIGAFLATACVLIVLYSFVFWKMLDAHHARAYDRLVSCLTQQAGLVVRNGDPVESQRWVDATARIVDADLVALVDPDGRILAVSPSPQAYESFAKRARFGTMSRIRPEDSSASLLAASSRITSRPVVHPTQSRVIGSLVVALPDPPNSLATLGVAHLLMLAVLAAIAWAVSVLLCKKIVRPVRALADLTERRLTDDLVKISSPTREIIKLQSLLNELSSDIHTWRSEASDLRNTVESRVTAKTRSIHTACRRAEKQSFTDSLTKCWNRRFLGERIESLVETHRGEEKDLAIVMIDVDNFKILNDTLGHQAGDEVLTFVGELLRNCIRQDDLAIRYGGDEFVLLLQGASAETAARVTSRILVLFRQQAPLFDVVPRVSLSGGIACLGEHEVASGMELLELADRALYTAKKSGKAGFVTVTPETATRP